MPFGPLRLTQRFGAGQYYVRLVVLWMYSIVWTAAVASLAVYWDEVNLPMKIVLVPLLVLGTPTIGDLFQSYAKYSAKWERDNAAGGG